MARKERRDNSKLRELMEEYGVKTMEDVHNFVKMLTCQRRFKFAIKRRINFVGFRREECRV
ncbi:hypothetical protein U6B65_06605 [Oscillospiraceae bacterium MB08-C2-2]|nr:hypothetical protein U6B65_06605 [Oscillospiraceae bacterium MB08-C2-2]